LLSVAFPPGYASKGYFYVYYTTLNGDNQVSRFYLTDNPDVDNPASEQLILYFNHPTYGNHNGGQLAFGPDGYLYIGTGDGGGGGDPNRNAQNLGALLGKILRIDVECRVTLPPGDPIQAFLPLISTNTLTQAYCLPPDNPFINTLNARPEIWAYGVRNPWRFSFDRLTGNLYIGDVGQNEWEEVDFQSSTSQGGENYGWNIMEGKHCYNASTCDQSGKVLPVWEQPHPTFEALTGGFVYRGPTYTSMQGFYFYGDYQTGRIWGLVNSGGWQSQELLDTAHLISTFGEDQAGELYLADYGSGIIYKVVKVP
jgi:glucose/arabinose dehydrogenase